MNYEYYPYPLPRAYIVSNAKFIDNDDRVLDELAVFDPSSEVVISGKGEDITGHTPDAREWTATVTKYTDEVIEIQTQSKRNGSLVLSDTYYPGWQAWIDGVEIPVMRANYDFKTISLPQGEHTVVFRFKSRYLNLGFLASIGGIFLVALVSFYTLFTVLFSKKNPLLHQSS